MQPQKERTTRKEQCYNRELGFSQWLRDNLPNSYLPFVISDIDYVIYNGQSNSMMFLEVKHYNSQVQPWQRDLFNMIHSSVKNNVGLNMKYNYKGFNLITLEKTGFCDGWVKLNDKLIGEKELIDFLSMHEAPPQWVGKS
jgi:hypothetical protein